MSLYNDLTTVLTPYANKIKQNESNVSEIQDTLEHLDVETDKTLSIDGKPADAKAVGDALAEAGSVTTDKLADGAVTTAKIADGAITARKIASGVIPAVDATLAQTGAAADAKAAGNAISALEDQFTEKTDQLKADLGDKSNLETIDKTNIVSAINSLGGVIPAVDATLTQTGAAADAKKTGDELADLRSTLDLSTPYNAYLASILCPDSLQFENGRRIQKKGFTVSMKWTSTNTIKLLWFFTGNEPLIVTDFGNIASTIPTSDQIVPIDGLKKLPLNLVYYINSEYTGFTRSQLFVHYLSVSEDEIETIKAVGITTAIMTDQKGLNVYKFNVPDDATHFALSYYSAGAGSSAIVTLGLERNYSDEIAKLQALALENA